MIDVIVSSPEVYQYAMSRAGIQKGGIVNGMLDTEMKRFPCLTRLMATSGIHPTTEMAKLLHDTLPGLIKVQLDQGRIPEAEFDRLGYPVDADAAGNTRENNATISQLSQLRCITLTHMSLRRERNELITYFPTLEIHPSFGD